MEYLFYGINILAIIALSPGVIGLIRVVRARIENRDEGDILLPYRSLLYRFRVGKVIPQDSSWISVVSPYILFTTTVVLASGIPIISLSTFAATGDILVFVYSLALYAFFLALGEMDSGSHVHDRRLTISAFAKVSLALALVGAVLMAGSTNLAKMASHLTYLPSEHMLALFLAGTAFFLALRVEYRETESSPTTGFLGARGALVEWASWNITLMYIAVLVNIFAPIGLATSLTPFELFAAGIIFLAKVVAAAVLIALTETLSIQSRSARVLAISCVLSIIAVLIVVV
jgi:formate hydrogenlyase subunit 4